MSRGAREGAAAMPAPGLPRRMGCFAYEGLLLFGVALIPAAIGALYASVTGQQHPLPSTPALRWMAFAIYAFYFTGLWSLRGQTLAMQTWNIEVVTARGERLSQPHALARFVASCAWFAPATLLASVNGWTGWRHLATVAVGVVAYALLALLHPQRQFWHDALCGTRLINAAR